MLFNSIPFLAFLPLVVIAYFLVPAKLRWLLLLIASYYFYMSWKAEYVLLIMASTLIDFYAGIKIESSKKTSKKKLFLYVSLIFNIGLLLVFKYYNFFVESIDFGLNSLFDIKPEIPYFNFLLPVGISFYTFQTLSYTLDVYKGRIKAEKHLGIFALYVSFFPQLVAGPIERSTRLLPQFKEKFNFEHERVVSGLRLIFFGFFQKLVVADNLAKYVNSVYNNVDLYSGFPLIFATLFFSIQIYNDFAGYSNIAIGSARLMGYDLMKNFNQPYLTTNLAEFWRSWHISLYTWFNDYLFNSVVIKYRKLGVHATSLGIILTFTLSGLWHGAAWTFVIWGILHGLGLSFLVYSKKSRKKINKKFNNNLYNFICFIVTFLFVNFTFIFFRSNSLADAFYIIKKVIRIDFNNIIGVPVFSKTTFISFLIFSTITFLYDILINKKIHEKISKYKSMSYCFFIIVTSMIYVFGTFEEQSFVYFQF